MTADTVTQWAHGACECNECGHRWIGVWALGAEDLECPKCHSTDTERQQEQPR